MTDAQDARIRKLALAMLDHVASNPSCAECEEAYAVAGDMLGLADAIEPGDAEAFGHDHGL